MHTPECIVRAPARPKSVRTIQEEGLVDSLQDLPYCLLDNLVLQAGDTERTGLALSGLLMMLLLLLLVE